MSEHEIHGTTWWDAREKDDSNYKSFRDSINFFLGDKDIDSMLVLRELMYGVGFRYKKVQGQKVRVYPKDLQVQFAWDYLKMESAKQLELGITEKRRFFISSDKRYRVAYSFSYGHKHYKRGQFAPRGVYENE
jgi:hypothetical protein